MNGSNQIEEKVNDQKPPFVPQCLLHDVIIRPVLPRWRIYSTRGSGKLGNKTLIYGIRQWATTTTFFFSFNHYHWVIHDHYVATLTAIAITGLPSSPALLPPDYHRWKTNHFYQCGIVILNNYVWVEPDMEKICPVSPRRLLSHGSQGR